MRTGNPLRILKKMHCLSDSEIDAIKSRFIKNRILNNNLYVGQFRDEIPTLIIGAPCIRKDILGISLNTFYQIFIPLKVANKLNVPCKIFLGVKEEIISQPKLFSRYKKLGEQIEKAIKKIATELKVDVEVVNTNSYKYDKLINECVQELDIQLSAEDSTYLFNLSLKKAPKPLHSTPRIISNKRVIACNTLYGLNKLFGRNNYLIVEDIEQHICVLFSRRFNENKTPNFLAFLPLPNISGTNNMFKSEKKERFILGKSRKYYHSIFKKFSPSTINIYEEFFNLLEKRDTNAAKDFGSFFKTANKISGIIFTMNPVNGDKSEIIIEYSRGLGDKLASGHQKPTYLKIKKDDYRKKCPLFLKDLIRIAIKLEKIFHGPQDIEWGYNDGKIFIFQSRPVTVIQDIPSIEIIKSKKLKMIGKGKIASRGQAGADLRLIKNKKDYLNLKKNEIIYGKKLDISIVGRIKHIAGIITSGGILSHIAVIAREFNIPCLVEPEGFDASDYKGQKIFLDGYKGKIFILK